MQEMQIVQGPDDVLYVYEQDAEMVVSIQEPEAMVTYACAGAPNGYRYRQFAKDPLPKWAVDVQAELAGMQ